MSLEVNLRDLATRMATTDKQLRTLINGNLADLTTLNTTAKSNLVAALNELHAALANASGIDDAAASTTTVYSSTKTEALVAQVKSDLINGAPEAYDTLQELATQLQEDDNALAAITTALGFRVRVDAAQTFDAIQQAQARSNIGAASAADVGDTTTNFVAVYEAGLV